MGVALRRAWYAGFALLSFGIVGADAGSAADLVPEVINARISAAVAMAVFGSQTGGFFTRHLTDALSDFGDPDTSAIAVSAANAVGADASQCREGTNSLADTYAQAVQSARWSKDLLDNQRRVRLSAAEATLFTKDDHPTQGYLDYMTYKRRLNAVQETLSQTPLAHRTAAQLNAVAAAEQDLDTLGDRKTFYPAEIDYRSLNALTSNGHFQLYEAKLPNGGEPAFLAQITFGPELAQIESKGGKTEIQLDIPLDGLETSWLGFSVSVSVDIFRVSINRPWLSPDFFSDDSWQSPDGGPQATPSVPLADGAGGGLIGQYVSKLIFVSNLKITIASGDNIKTRIAAAVAAQSTGKIGPFVIFDRAQFDAPYTAHIDTATHSITSNVMTLLGCQLHLLPRSPNPNPQYKW